MKKIMIIVMFFVIAFISCNIKGKADNNDNHQNTDSTGYLTDKLRVGDSVPYLVNKGYLVKNVLYGQNINQGKYTLTDRNYAGINFTSDHLMYYDKNKLLCVFLTMEDVKSKEMQTLYNKASKYLTARYGKNVSDSSSIEKDELFGKTTYNDWTWHDKQKNVDITVSTTVYQRNSDCTFEVMLSTDLMSKKAVCLDVIE